VALTSYARTLAASLRNARFFVSVARYAGMSSFFTLARGVEAATTVLGPNLGTQREFVAKSNNEQMTL
jgi:hypothetical protein